MSDAVENEFDSRERKLRHFLSRWEFWAIIFGFAIVFLISAVGVIGKRQWEDRSDRIAAEKVQATAEVTACFSQLRDGPDTLKLLGLLVALADNSVKSNEEALAVPAPPELQRIRNEALKRVRPLRESAKRFVARVRTQIPTLATCKAMARLYGLNPRQIRVTIEKKLQPKKQQPQQGGTRR